MIFVMKTVIGILFVLLIASGIAYIVLGLIEERRRIDRLSSSSCAGRAWREAFPNTAKKEIRAFLDIVLLSFGLADRYRLRFDPSVRIMDLYHVVEPPGLSLGVDSMELETLAEEVEQQHGVDLGACWHDEMTLGEAFAKTQARSP